MKVMTIKGLIDFDELRIHDVITVGDNYRKIATEYYYGEELVRRSVTAEAFRPLETVAEQGAING